jgi:hypothetical protein
MRPVVDQLKANAVYVDRLSSAVSRGEGGLQAVPGLLRQVLADDRWKEFRTKLGAHVTHERFEDFVTARPMRGLGVDVDLIRRIVADDMQASSDLTKALKREPGRPKGQTGTTDNVSNSRPVGTHGNSKEQALRRLRTQRPDLHARVLAGELSPHAAAIEAGFRKKTITVPLDPEAAARTLARHFTADEWEWIVQLVRERGA